MFQTHTRFARGEQPRGSVAEFDTLHITQNAPKFELGAGFAES